MRKTGLERKLVDGNYAALATDAGITRAATSHPRNSLVSGTIPALDVFVAGPGAKATPLAWINFDCGTSLSTTGDGRQQHHDVIVMQCRGRGFAGRDGGVVHDDQQAGARVPSFCHEV